MDQHWSNNVNSDPCIMFNLVDSDRQVHITHTDPSKGDLFSDRTAPQYGGSPK